MRTAFGGLCRSDALWNSAIRIPWQDGGCVPQAPPGLEAVAAVDGIMALSWQSPDDDGGSRITGYKVQWKSGAQEYDTSREASVTDLADLSHTIEGLSHGIDYTIRILPYNINGDGAASEVTETAVGSEAALGTLTLAGATLYPTFSSTTTSYAAATGHAATVADADASVAFLDGDGNVLTDAGAADGFQVDLLVGANVIQVRVTAQDGVTATYTVTVTRAEANTSLSPPASDSVPASPSSALYTIVFRGEWTTDVTPGGLPSGAHFSPLIGGVHGAGVTFLESGGAASTGVESMAEIGGTSALRNEVQAAINATPATALSVLRRSGNIGATGSDTLSDVELTTAFPRVTLTTMIAPSHDWFVGVSGLPLLNAQGDWQAWLRVFLYPWDAGSEEGNDFSLSPSVDTNPRGVIHSIRGTGKFTTKRIANLTFTLTSISPSFPATESGTRSVAENTAAGEDIGDAFQATDPDTGDSVSYSLSGPDAASFAIVASSGQLRTKAALDYETTSSYAVTVTATDSSQLTAEIDVTITVTNVDEEGNVTLFPAQSRVGTVLRATLSDPDGELRSVNWRWERSSDQTNWTSRSGSDASYTPTSGDAGMYLRASASYTDGEGAGKSAEAASDHSVGAREAAPDITIVELVSGLSIPWDLTFTPDGTMLFTQRSGVLSARLPDGTVQTITADFGDLYVSGEAGLMATVIDPSFASNRRFYTCQTHTGPTVQVIAWTINTAFTAATRVNDPLVGGIPAASFHDGCRLRFGPQGYLWIATGDGASGTVPQDLTSLGGKVLRVDASTGAGAPGNPFASSPRVYTYGHRNPQGLALRPGTSQMWSVEHGPNIDDEINRLVKGGNYGWNPVPGYNESVPMTDLEQFPDAVEAKWASGNPTLATSGGVFLKGADWGEWEDRLAVATLITQSLRIFDFTSSGTFVSQVVVPQFDGTYGRLRSPVLGPEGALYVTTSNGNGTDVILKVAPSLPPSFAAATDAQAVDENSPVSTLVATVTATDPEGQALTYTLSGPDAASFNLASAARGQLRANSSLDHEARSSYEVFVTASDPYGLSDSVTLTISVTDVNEPPAFPSSGTGVRRVAENTPSGVNIGAPVTATDPDNDPLTYTLGGTDAAVFGIVASTGQLRTAGALDRERKSTYTVSVGVRDSRDAGGDPDMATDTTITVTISVTDVNEPPEFTATRSDREIAENSPAQTLVGAPVTANDPDNDTLTYTLDDNGGDLFTIDGNGQIRVKQGTVLDHEDQNSNSYSVTVTATDPSNATDSIPVDITVTDVNEPPEFTALRSDREIAENSPAQTPVGAPVTANDPDNDTLTYTLDDNGGDLFTIDGNGQIRVKQGTVLDHEDQNSNSYSVTVTATDPSNATDSVTLTISVTDVNEPPAFPSSETGVRRVAENTPSGLNIGDPVAARDDDNDPLTYTLGGTDAAVFGIVASTGQLRTAGALDRERKSTYTVSVGVRDSRDAGGDPDLATDTTITITISVTDVNEPPEFTAPRSDREIAENSPAQTLVGAPVTANDPDNDTLTYTLDDNGGDLFTIDGNGQIRVKQGTVLDHEDPNSNSYSVTVTATDPSNATDSVTLTISVTDVNEPPAFPVQRDRRAARGREHAVRREHR